MMRNIKFTVCKEGIHYVSQCLNADVSSFGETVEEAIRHLGEAVELYFEKNTNGADYIPVEQAMIGELSING